MTRPSSLRKPTRYRATGDVTGTLMTNPRFVAGAQHGEVERRASAREKCTVCAEGERRRPDLREHRAVARVLHEPGDRQRSASCVCLSDTSSRSPAASASTPSAACPRFDRARPGARSRPQRERTEAATIATRSPPRRQYVSATRTAPRGRTKRSADGLESSGGSSRQVVNRDDRRVRIGTGRIMLLACVPAVVGHLSQHGDSRVGAPAFVSHQPGEDERRARLSSPARRA